MHDANLGHPTAQRPNLHANLPAYRRVMPNLVVIVKTRRDADGTLKCAFETPAQDDE